MEPILRVRSLVKTFTLHTIDGQRVPAVRGVDLDVARGEHVVLVGPSGAGKSSVLKCIYRTYLPTAGAVWFHTEAGAEVDLARLGDAALADLRDAEIGYVTQFLRAEPRRGALDVVARAGVRSGMDPEQARRGAGALLDRLGLDRSLWATYPVLLSGGEQQRVNLAAATLAPARLLLLDEPISALDETNRAAALAHIAELAARGVAVLGVFHDPAAIAQVATRVIALEHGAVAGDHAGVR